MVLPAAAHSAPHKAGLQCIFCSCVLSDGWAPSCVPETCKCQSQQIRAAKTAVMLASAASVRRRRVEKRQLVALVADGSALPCMMPDIEVITKIVTYYERWQVRPGCMWPLPAPLLGACARAQHTAQAEALTGMEIQRSSLSDCNVYQ